MDRPTRIIDRVREHEISHLVPHALNGASEKVLVEYIMQLEGQRDRLTAQISSAREVFDADFNAFAKAAALLREGAKE